MMTDQLRQLGWCDAAAEFISPRELSAVVKDYQQFHGLKPDGIVGPVTKASLDRPRICAHPELMLADTDGLCLWEKVRDGGELTWTVANGLPGITRDEIVDAVEWAFVDWKAACNIRHRYSPNAATVDVNITVGRIDRPGRTLAWAELPCGPDAPLLQRYDLSEAWSLELNPSSGISLPTVIKHEIGHTLGSPHVATREGVALMNPIYDPDVYMLTPLDLEEGVDRYGPPPAADEPDEPPPPDDPPTDTVPLTITLGGKRYTWQVTAVGE